MVSDCEKKQNQNERTKKMPPPNFTKPICFTNANERSAWLRLEKESATGFRRSPSLAILQTNLLSIATLRHST